MIEKKTCKIYITNTKLEKLLPYHADCYGIVSKFEYYNIESGFFNACSFFQFPMSRLREHRSSCATTPDHSFSPVAPTSQPWPE